MFDKFELVKTMIVAILLCIASSSFCSAQEAIPASTLESLKDATVFIRVEQERNSGTGSGFLIIREDNRDTLSPMNMWSVRKGKVDAKWKSIFIVAQNSEEHSWLMLLAKTRRGI